MSLECILGIDAAWTTHQPSGVALVTGVADDWRCVAMEPSYQRFIERAGLQGPGTLPQSALLIQAAEDLAQAPVTVVALDIPLAHTPITCRRVSDNAVSKQYGNRGCGTHSPSAERPGLISKLLYEGFSALGFDLLTTTHSTAPKKMIEVYPHVALLRLMNASYRVPYKISKSRQYMPQTPLRERSKLLREEMARILWALHAHISNIDLLLPQPEDLRSLSALKSYEDMIDALVCCWMGILMVTGEAVPLGDEDSAIWVPNQHTFRAKGTEPVFHA
jgi:predicted RNase H-like nuclease